MYPKLGAIPTPTGEEGEAGEPDKVPNEYANEGQQSARICKMWTCSCSMRTTAVFTILAIASIVGCGFLYHHLTSTVLPPSYRDQATDHPVPKSTDVMFAFSLQ